MAAILKILKVASTPLEHPQKVSFGLVEGFESYGLNKIWLKKNRKKKTDKNNVSPLKGYRDGRDNFETFRLRNRLFNFEEDEVIFTLLSFR
jgi:hypothetical protein